MGWNVVRSESRWPEERSRLWTFEDGFKVLKNNLGTKSIVAISLDMSKIAELKLRATVFEGMPYLKFVEFYDSPLAQYSRKQKIVFPEDIRSLPSALRIL
ncbi:hypothetical protein QQP08_014265 [Theobroma cacao]|nr:hypothetical protein QQP08_014265 [Theobroma cacao]